MVYGVWLMVYGLWFMVYGLWFMVYGLGSRVQGGGQTSSSGFGSRVLGFGVWASGLRFRSGFGVDLKLDLPRLVVLLERAPDPFLGFRG